MMFRRTTPILACSRWPAILAFHRRGRWLRVRRFAKSPITIGCTTDRDSALSKWLIARAIEVNRTVIGGKPIARSIRILMLRGRFQRCHCSVDFHVAIVLMIYLLTLLLDRGPA